MGGGSSDCGFMITLLNQMFQLGLSDQQMIDYAARLGADCAFFILNKPCYAEGIGERLEPISLSLRGWYLAVVRPAIPVSTKEAFSLITPQHPAVKRCQVPVPRSSAFSVNPSPSMTLPPKVPLKQ